MLKKKEEELSGCYIAFTASEILLAKLSHVYLEVVETYKSNTTSDDQTESRAGHVRGASSERESRLGGHGAALSGSTSARGVGRSGSGTVCRNNGCRGGSSKSSNDGDDGELHFDVWLGGVCPRTSD